MTTKSTDAISGQTFKRIPAVVSFKRCHVVSDALMLSLLPDATEVPVGIYREGIRGTQNVNDGLGNLEQKKSGSEGNRGVQQVQHTEIARLDDNAESLVVRFGLAFLDIGQSLDMCTDSTSQLEATQFRASLNDFIARAKRSGAIDALALRYARNIANARWLWRNRSIAQSILVTVSKRDGKVISVFDAKEMSILDFDHYNDGEVRLGKEIAAQLRGTSSEGLIVEANITLRVPGGVEVFPSQNFIEKDKGKTDNAESSRSLYKSRSVRTLTSQERSAGLLGHAAIRDQKIFNAIRTIDTWYPDFEETGYPIPVEPLGASIQFQEFFRKGRDTSFEMFKSLSLLDPESDDGLYCLACLERGGVYGPAKAATEARKDPKAKEVKADKEETLEKSAGQVKLTEEAPKINLAKSAIKKKEKKTVTATKGTQLP
jgi:CRISPR-associated protein Csy3